MRWRAKRGRRSSPLALDGATPACGIAPRGRRVWLDPEFSCAAPGLAANGPGCEACILRGRRGRRERAEPAICGRQRDASVGGSPRRRRVRPGAPSGLRPARPDRWRRGEIRRSARRADRPRWRVAASNALAGLEGGASAGRAARSASSRASGVASAHRRTVAWRRSNAPNDRAPAVAQRSRHESRSVAKNPFPSCAVFGPRLDCRRRGRGGASQLRAGRS